MTVLMGREMSDYYVGVDIGGTFTDCAVVAPDGAITVGKVPSTPGDFSDGFFAAIADAAGRLGLSTEDLLSRTRRLAHGTTVGINALVTRSGATVGLLTTKGHADVLRIRDNTGRVTGANVDEILHYAASTLPDDFVSPECTGEIVERIDFSGDVVVALDRGQAKACIADLIGRGVEEFAISLLWSFANPAHELELEQLVRESAPDAGVSVGHRIAPRLGEYPRAATAVFNAYIGPLMRSYIDRIGAGARSFGYGRPVLFATCSGGLIEADVARTQPLLTVKSGPVAGVVATALLGEQCGHGSVIATDMGGTTLDVSVVTDGRARASDTAVIERHEAHIRMIDVESIGAGGGSIAWIDETTNGLRVGPRSAGSVPGPVAYGRGGTEPTVTDADLVLGVLSPDGLLGGGLRLDLGRAEEAIGKLADRIGIELRDCAAGIIEIVDSQMEDLVRRMTIQQGRDPREAVIYGIGGAAASHAPLYGRGLGVQRLVVPLADVASVWSALGVAIADVVRVYDSPIYLSAPFEPEQVARAYERLEATARNDLERDALEYERLVLRRASDMRYGLQVFEVESDAPSGDLRSESAMAEMVASFEREYANRFGVGSGYAEAGVLLTGLRVEARGVVARPKLCAPPRDAAASAAEAQSGERAIYWWERREDVATPIYAGARLPAGETVAGPAVIEYPETTAVVRPGQSAYVDELGSLIVNLRDGDDR
jgi:N-methylhydantoinase A